MARRLSSRYECPECEVHYSRRGKCPECDKTLIRVVWCGSCEEYVPLTSQGECTQCGRELVTKVDEDYG